MLKKLFVVAVLILFFTACHENEKPVKDLKLYVGTYTDGTSEGIYSLQFNSETGALDSLKLIAKMPNPSFLALSKDKNYLYAVQETADYDSLGGGVSAFKINGETLELLNNQGTGGAHPCHVALSDDGQLAVSNYTGGNLSIFDLEADGTIGKRQLIDHKVLDTTRKAHVHKAHFNRDGLFVADLGLDALKRYTKKNKFWVPAHQSSIDLRDGAGPRHFIFNTERSFLYVINELEATITVFEREDEGSYNPIQTESTLGADWQGVKSCADIHLSSDGRFLYGSNRGENTIVIFGVDQVSGKLTLIGRESVRGDWPRNFTFDPSGNFLIVANQKSNNITVFKHDSETGTLEFLNELRVGSPVCLVFE